MLTAFALSALALHPGPHGFWFIGPIFGLLWFGLILALVIVLARRGRRGGPWGWGPGHGPGGSMQAVRSAETVLAERYAQGDIDEKEYRARLEVLRASAPQPPQG